ncbi:M1 family metallopeptidase [Microbulbifer pacificus]|uniref:M1 family metallopeptidase n=1 Tax=Microbulbifer pacificus TaxID=407164 RepID=A0AAU0MY95_9GAMM|nr:M1 family metallopeptidase [Microbulbifer pacificus]WOX04731.1 M1 family metallopeptidase [Microbulbifer pacificus]
MSEPPVLRRHSHRRTCGILLGTTLLCTLSAGASSHAATGTDSFVRLSQTDLNLGSYRSGTGMPTENYWQQQVDYDLNARLDTHQQRLLASADIRYHNNSPDALPALYFFLDHNALKVDAKAVFRLFTAADEKSRKRAVARKTAQGFAIDTVTDGRRQALNWQVHDTLLKVPLPEPLSPGKTQYLHIQWQLPLIEKNAAGARSGYETLADGSRIYVIAQWFPRAAAYTDYAGWQLKPFLQQGEFSTEFGDYSARIEVPEDFVVAASGELQNPTQVLNGHQLELWRRKSTEPGWMIDGPQARQRRAANRNAHATDTRSWQFTGQQLRDFAFSASASFQWQIQYDQRGRRLQQFFPAEAAPLWEKFGLPAIAHSLDVFDSALMPLDTNTISVVNASGIGMEYPGLATIPIRPERSVSTRRQPAWEALTKYDFIGTVIHEVGHNYLPMRINTDEREWAWLDEGLVSFIEYRAEHSWEANFDVIYGEPRSIAAYTASADHQPIMTSADSLLLKIDNAYNKSASVMNVLRHLVLGPEVFDPALRSFAQAWIGKRPMPGDLFRALETSAGTDLSWFWRSWFYGQGSIDLSLHGIARDGKALSLQPWEQTAPPALALTSGDIQQFVVDRAPQLADSYTRTAQNFAPQIPVPLPAAEDSSVWYTLTIDNHGSAILPIPLELVTREGNRYHSLIPAETWGQSRNNRLTLELPLPRGQQLSRLCIDPLWLIPDTQRNNNCAELPTL